MHGFFHFQFGGIDVTTCRNYFGRQRQSFESNLELEDEELTKVGYHIF